jgi:SpoVK/Ycf46/Vps4 family AAA+-type ATPase
VESETRFAEIFEASKDMGKSIIFIDVIDALATSMRNSEAARKMLSRLLRKIHGFESDGKVLKIYNPKRSKDLDPALLSSQNITIKFDLMSLIFQKYVKQLNQDVLEELRKISQDLSGRDIANICKDAERRWNSIYIRKEKSQFFLILKYIKNAYYRFNQMKAVIDN